MNIIPLVTMSFKEKILSIVFLIIFLSIILLFIFREPAIILIAIVLIILLFYIYLFDEKTKIETNEHLSNRNLAIVNNQICVRPSYDNPFMNPSIVDYSNNNNDIKACPYNEADVEHNVNSFFVDFRWNILIFLFWLLVCINFLFSRL